MCAVIVIDGQEYETVAELKTVCSVLIKSESFGSIIDEYCLCQLDLSNTASANGFKYVWDGYSIDAGFMRC